MLRIAGDSLVGHSDIVIGRVVGIHVRGDFVTDEGVSFFSLCFLVMWEEEGKGEGEDTGNSGGDGKAVDES